MRLAFEVAGDGEPVTLLHGFSQGGAVWRGLLEFLPAGWSWLLVDIRGHGGSQAPPGAPHTLEACAGDLARLWDHLGIDTTHLVGYSMGGRLALYTASRVPERVRSLLTIGAHAGLEGEDREKRRQADLELARRIEEEGIEWFVEQWQARPMFSGLARRGSDYVAGLKALRLRNRPEGLVASLRGMGPGACDPFWDDLAAIGCPCTFVAGADDQRYRGYLDRLREAVPDGSTAVIDGAGHAAHLEQPKVFAALLQSQLSSR